MGDAGRLALAFDAPERSRFGPPAPRSRGPGSESSIDDGGATLGNITEGGAERLHVGPAPNATEGWAVRRYLLALVGTCRVVGKAVFSLGLP